MSYFTNSQNSRKVVVTFLTSLFCFSSFSPVIASPPPKIEKNIAREKGLLDGIFKGGKICLTPGLCLKTTDITEALLAKQIRDIAKNNAPITASSDNLFPVVGSLPDQPFEPAILDLSNAQPDEVIPAGDYVIPVRAYCLQKRASSPNAHRYILGQYGGKKQKALAALNTAAAKANAPHSELQSLSWAIQSGVAYQEMPREMQTLFNNLIPEYRNSLNQDFWQQIESIWNSGSKVLNLPSFRSFVGNKLGDTGTGLLTFMDARERLINRGSDWRNLSDIFILNDSTQGSGNILNTPWSQLSENIYARFITEGNAGDTGFLLLRIKETPQQTKALPLLAIAGAALTVYELYDLISTLMALPEGNANIQPLAMSIAEDFAIDTATDRACQAIKPRGRITGLLSILCNVGTRRPGKPGRGKNPEKIASGNNRGVNSGNNIKKPDSRPNQQLKSVHRVQKPGNQLPPNKKYLSDASVPSHYRQDSRFNNLASDPDQGFKTTPKTRAEAIAGLEAETQNLVSKPIKRGPKGIEFYDADGNPWDVKTPTSPSPGESWKFDSKDAVTAIKKELRDKTQLLSDGTKTPPGTFLNGNTGQPVPRKVILDSSYMNPADHQALWQRLNQELTPDELNRIVEIVNLP